MKFSTCPEPTIGVEWELQLLNAESLDLADGIMPLMEFYPDSPFVKPEYIQSCVELNSKPCPTASAAVDHLHSLARGVGKKCERLGMRLCSAGTHPFGRRLALITPTRRYHRMEKNHGYIGHNQITFATHIHVGMRSGDDAIRVMRYLTPCLPVLMAVSANSPFWRGYDSGYAAYRHRILAATPHYGLPPYFGGWNEFVEAFNMAQRARMIESFKDIHWDIRPHPDFGTLEVRVMDAQIDLDALRMIAALTRSLVVYIADQSDELLDRALPARLPYWIERENHYRASHQALAAQYIIDEKGQTRPLMKLVTDIIEQATPAAEKIGEGATMNALQEWVEHGAGYQEQRRVFAETSSLLEVVRHLAAVLDEKLKEESLASPADGP